MGIDATSIIINEFAVRPDLLRRAVAQHQSWTEQQLGVSLSDVVILETELDIAQIGIELLLAIRRMPYLPWQGETDLATFSGSDRQLRRLGMIAHVHIGVLIGLLSSHSSCWLGRRIHFGYGGSHLPLNC